MRYSRELKEAFKVSIPVMMGYTVLGFAFGLLLVSFEYPWYLALIMSVFIYAGALQFLAVGFFTAKAGLFDIAISSIFVNIRQSFYGLSVLKKFKKTGWMKPYLIFGLTDENYGLLTTIKPNEQLSKKHYYLYLAILNQSYWVFGSVCGAVFGSMVSFNTQGLEFSLTALFVVLAIEQYKKNKHSLPFIIGGCSAIIAMISVSSNNMLIVSIVLALVTMILMKKRIENAGN